MGRLLRGRGGFAIGVLEFGILFLGGGLGPFAWERRGSRSPMESSVWTDGCLDFAGKNGGFVEYSVSWLLTAYRGVWRETVGLGRLWEFISGRIRCSDADEIVERRFKLNWLFDIVM